MARDEAYRNAEKKIEEARRTGATKLDLGGMKLTELPESLVRLAQLQSLKLFNNQLTALPESLGELAQLQSLELSNNQLTALPESLGELAQLQSLELSNNQLTALPESLGELAQLQSLGLSNNQLTALPESLGRLAQLQKLYVRETKLTTLPEWIGGLTQLQILFISGNEISSLPKSFSKLSKLLFLEMAKCGLKYLPEKIQSLVQLKQLHLQENQISQLPLWLTGLKQLEYLHLASNNLTVLPDWLGELSGLKKLYFGRDHYNGNPITELPANIGQIEKLEELDLAKCSVVDLPLSLLQIENLKKINLKNNPLNPELAEAYQQGFDAVKLYLRLKTGPQVILNETKLILVGEGEVGKTCLMDALLSNAWQEHPSTHGIAIKPILVTDPDTHKVITLNGWDFGGQRVYRPTHQLFFSAPAVYLVVWKPREGPQQGVVKEWIQLVKRREPSAKILVVATHGGPGLRQPDIDRQELWDLFGREMVVDFFWVESKPDDKGERRGIEDLKRAIARVAVTLPEVGRSVPKRWQEVREALAQTEAAYLPFKEVLDLCRARQMDEHEARLFVTIEHRLGHLIHYQHDPTLRDLVVLKPDWLATAISFVLDDELTRKAHGLVLLSHLSALWDDPTRAVADRYPAHLHPIFVRLMERFDLSYRVADPAARSDAEPQSLIAQLVPDLKPDPVSGWADYPAEGNAEQTQICRIVDAQSGQSATAEGLFYQLIVRLHKYSLGRVDYAHSVHWQRGLVLDDDYNGRALLEHAGNDVRITVRAPYPERFLAMLTEEVKYLVGSFWEGLRCDVTVPCLNPQPCMGLFEVRKLIENVKRGRPEQPCPICNEWQAIDELLHNAPAAQPNVTVSVFAEFAEVKTELAKARQQISYIGEKTMTRFDRLDERTRRILSRVDNAYTYLLQVLTDEAKEGPRLFSLVPVNRTAFNPRQWTSAKFSLTLWCEHSRLPLPALNGRESKKGVYELQLTREWFKKAALFLKFVTGTLSLVLPVASSGIKLALDETAYKAIEEQLDFGKDIIDASLDASEKVGDWLGSKDAASLEHGEGIRADGATLRELQALLKAKDPGFGGLVRVLNKRQEFLWVHSQFEKEY